MPISILMYHQVGEFPAPAAHRSLFCQQRRFEGQMRWLARMGYKVISLREAVSALQGERALSGHAVVLSFDDGYLNFAQAAWPVLKRYGFPAALFPVAGLLGERTEWHAAAGRESYPLLSGEELIRLRREGVEIGAHTMKHPRLGGCDPERQANEIGTSKAALEKLLGEEVPFFCYPFGDFDRTSVSLVRKAGFLAALTCIRGAAVPGDDLMLLPRKAISYGDSLAGFWWKLHMKHPKKPDHPFVEDGCTRC